MATELLRSSSWRHGRHAGTRAKDTDRNDTCQILDSALSEGQLSMEEHRERVKAATNAATLGELQSLVSDLQNSNAPVQLPNLKKPRGQGAGGGWGMRAAVAGVLVVLGIAIGWGLYGNTHLAAELHLRPRRQVRRHHTDGADAPHAAAVARRADWADRADEEAFGDTNGYRLIVYPDYASLTRPDPNEERRELNYTYRGGWDDPTTSSQVQRRHGGRRRQVRHQGRHRRAARCPGDLGHQTGRRRRAPTSASTRAATRPLRAR